MHFQLKPTNLLQALVSHKDGAPSISGLLWLLLAMSPFSEDNCGKIVQSQASCTKIKIRIGLLCAFITTMKELSTYDKYF